MKPPKPFDQIVIGQSPQEVMALLGPPDQQTDIAQGCQWDYLHGQAEIIFGKSTPLQVIKIIIKPGVVKKERT